MGCFAGIDAGLQLYGTRTGTGIFRSCFSDRAGCAGGTAPVHGGTDFLLLSLGGFYVLSNFGKQFFVQHVWLAQSAGELNNTLGGTVGGVKSLLNLSGIKGLIKIAIGQLFAANASAYGILTLAVVLAVPIIWNGCKKNMCLTKQKAPDERHTAWLLALFQLLLFLGAFGISILFLGNHGSAAVTRGDYFIYTRYISNVLGICLFALYAVLRHAYRLRLLAVAGILFAGICCPFFCFPIPFRRRQIRPIPPF